MDNPWGRGRFQVTAFVLPGVRHGLMSLVVRLADLASFWREQEP